LTCLSKLMSLDLSENRISAITSKQFPPSITFLNLLDNPILENNDFDEDSFLKEFPAMKVYNKILLNNGEASSEETEEEADESEIACLQDLTRHLKATSKERQTINEENHQNKITTLALLKTEMMSNRQTNSLCSLQENYIPQKETSEQLSRNCLPPLDRPLSSQSLSKKSGQLEPLPSSPSLSRLKSPPLKQNDNKQVARLNTPKRVTDRSGAGAGSASLRQPLEMELVKADDFDDYLVDVNKKFTDLRSKVEGL